MAHRVEARLLDALVTASARDTLGVQLAMFIDGFVSPEDFHNAARAVAGAAIRSGTREDTDYVLRLFNDILDELEDLLCAGVNKCTAPEISALRSRSKYVFSSIGGLGQFSGLYVAFWELKHS